MRSFPIPFLGGLCSLLALASCGSDGALSEAQAEQVGAYVIVDLRDGSLSFRRAIDDLVAGDAVRDHLLVLRRVPGRTYQLGAAGQDDDEAPRSAAVRMCFVGVFEVTGSQWSWLADGHAVGTASSQPRAGMTLDAVMAGLAAFATRTGVPLAVPTDDEWEAAARALPAGGEGDAFPAGRVNVDRAALVRESALASATAITGPERVGSRQPTGLGFYDMIGNAWELCASGRFDGLDANGFVHIHGGSWADGVDTARASNAVQIDAACAHPDIGFRVVLRP